MRDNPAVAGAIVTAHKLRLYRACGSALTRGDRLVDLTHEINTLATVDGTVAGDARDAVSLTHVLPTVLRHVASLPTAALVINATGLGKDAPGSPLTDDAPFQPGTVSWDFTYRGDLTFLQQARATGATTVDGWDYFVAGWAGGLSAIAGIPFTSDLLAQLSRAAAEHRPTGVPR